MKLLKTIFILVLFKSLAFGELSIDERILAIQNAPSKQRVKLMNEFKTILSTMNHEQRANAIKGLRSSIKADKQVNQNLPQNKIPLHPLNTNKEIHQHKPPPPPTFSKQPNGIKNQPIGKR